MYVRSVVSQFNPPMNIFLHVRRNNQQRTSTKQSSSKQEIRGLERQNLHRKQEIQVSPRRRPGFQNIVQLESMITGRSSPERGLERSGRPLDLERGI